MLSSQDLISLDIGLATQEHLVESVHVQTAPESFVAHLDQQLKAWSVSLNALEGVIVVTGPGSFTSSRLIVIIANTIAFRFQIPVFPVQNPHRLSLESLLTQIDFAGGGTDIASPVYDRPPFIT